MKQQLQVVSEDDHHSMDDLSKELKQSAPPSSSRERLKNANDESIRFVGGFEGETPNLDHDDLTDSQYDGSSVGSKSSAEDDDNSEQTTDLGNGLLKLRMSVVIIFCFLALFIPLVIFLVARANEKADFESEFRALSGQVIDELENRFGVKVCGIDGMSITSTSHALDSNSTWPFVTLDDFDLMAKKELALTGTPVLKFQPIVQSMDRGEWEEYADNNIDWIRKARGRDQTLTHQQKKKRRSLVDAVEHSKEIWKFNQVTYEPIIEEVQDLYLPVWQHVPLNPMGVNFNILSDEWQRGPVESVLESGLAVLSRVHDPESSSEQVSDILNEVYSHYLQQFSGDQNMTYNGEPTTNLYYPVFDSFDRDRAVVGVYTMTIFWELLFSGMLPTNANPVVCVVENACGDVFTYETSGDKAIFLGYGDLHDDDYDDFEVFEDFSLLRQAEKFRQSQTAVALNEDFCPYTLRVYPSEELEDAYESFEPFAISIATAIFFFLIAAVAAFYDLIVRIRSRKILSHKKNAEDAVALHYPDLVVSRLLAQKRETNGKIAAHPKARIKTYLNDKKTDTKDDLSFLTEQPIADLFLNCTVLFGDICGFSAWSSEREPEQVFLLLECIFQSFDRIARRRGVFKVETVADSYVAVTGLPEKQPDHAVRMTRFARDCLISANETTRALEVTLGPDTGELRFRFGLHSGQVTGGVLRGEKARFQLFGDTVNTASRMESTGEGNRIHLSPTTANLLIEAGKEDWVRIRPDPVVVKGKGIIKTYWAVHQSSDNSLSASRRSSGPEMSLPPKTDESKEQGFYAEKDMWGNDDKGIYTIPPTTKISKNKRLVDWLVDIFQIQLKRVIAQRKAKQAYRKRASPRFAENPGSGIKKGEMVLDEVVEAFVMPEFVTKQLTIQIDPDSIELDPKIVLQLRGFINAVCMLYKDNSFHNFEHASHVTMSAIKLLNRVVVPEDIDYAKRNVDAIHADLHDYSYGITSDALAQFAVAFSTLVHDADHRGVPNGQLSKELPKMGEKYQQRSVAEQNSVDLTWDLLMGEQFKDLQACIFANEKEIARFRHYVVNLVMATDIFEKEMKLKREERWKKAFNYDNESCVDQSVTTTTKSHDSFLGVSERTKRSGVSEQAAANLKATIVLEHIIQAADVSHTMQHWKVYKKWNERLFQEMYAAYEAGRAEKDPSEGWYGGELWFFDNYIIPLAKKLEECGVFGVSSDECLNYAKMNRNEWAAKGKAVVKEMVERYKKRKMLEVGGFTQEEINAFTPKELEHLLELLIKKGRAFGSLMGTDPVGQVHAAQAWLDALEIHERCPASPMLKDHTMIFPVFSGLTVFMKGGKILQDEGNEFEQNLAGKFVRDSKRFGDPVHYTRALAMLCEVQARSGKLNEALETFEEIRSTYNVVEHTAAISKAYGTDRSSHAFAQSAVWYHELGDTGKSLSACEYVSNELLPHMEPDNILNSCELLLPVMRIQAYRGEVKEMRDFFDVQVVQNYTKFEIKFTPCRVIFKPMVWLLEIWHDPDNFAELSEAVDWLLEEESNGVINDFLDTIYVKLGWACNTMTSDLILRVAKKLHSDGGDREKVESLVKLGMKAAMSAEWKMKNDGGDVILPVAFEIQEPVTRQLTEFAEELGLEIDLGNIGRNGKLSKPLETSFGLVVLCA